MPDERVSERDLTLPTLELLASRADGFISTADLILELTAIFKPEGKDAEIVPGRSDTYFSQKVRNMVSHRTGATSFIMNGYAEYVDDRRGIRISDAGRAFLRQQNGA